MKDWRVATIAIVAIAGLEALALSNGVDHYYFGLAVAAIAGIGGYKLKHFVDWFRGK